MPCKQLYMYTTTLKHKYYTMQMKFISLLLVRKRWTICVKQNNEALEGRKEKRKCSNFTTWGKQYHSGCGLLASYTYSASCCISNYTTPSCHKQLLGTYTSQEAFRPLFIIPVWVIGWPQHTRLLTTKHQCLLSANTDVLTVMVQTHKQNVKTSTDVITPLEPYTIPHNHPYISSCKPDLLR